MKYGLNISQKTLRTSAAALATAFGFAAAPAGALANGIEEAPTLWKTVTFDAVISLKPCPPAQGGVCGEVYWLNPKDKTLFDYFGDKAAHSGSVTDADVSALCGFSPRLDFKQTAPNRWQGTMDLRGKGMTVNVDATRINDREMKVDTSKFVIRQSETWTRVDASDPRYPKCEKPKP